LWPRRINYHSQAFKRPYGEILNQPADPNYETGSGTGFQIESGKLKAARECALKCKLNNIIRHINLLPLRSLKITRKL
jgi:hypothetical protein